MSAKEEVRKMIAKRQRQNSVYKANAAKRAGPDQIVKEFIENMQAAIRDSQSVVEFDFSLQKEVGILEDRMKSIDPYVQLAVIWNREDLAENWKDLHVDGVRISWSPYHLNINKEKEKESYITVISLFMNGKLD